MLENKDKLINKIQQILAFTKAKIFSNRATRVIEDLAIIFKKKLGIKKENNQ